MSDSLFCGSWRATNLHRQLRHGRRETTGIGRTDVDLANYIVTVQIPRGGVPPIVDLTFLRRNAVFPVRANVRVAGPAVIHRGLRFLGEKKYGEIPAIIQLCRCRESAQVRFRVGHFHSALEIRLTVDVAALRSRSEALRADDGPRHENA